MRTTYALVHASQENCTTYSLLAFALFGDFHLCTTYIIMITYFLILGIQGVHYIHPCSCFSGKLHYVQPACICLVWWFLFMHYVHNYDHLFSYLRHSRCALRTPFFMLQENCTTYSLLAFALFGDFHLCTTYIIMITYFLTFGIQGAHYVRPSSCFSGKLHYVQPACICLVWWFSFMHYVHNYDHLFSYLRHSRCALRTPFFMLLRKTALRTACLHLPCLVICIYALRT